MKKAGIILAIAAFAMSLAVFGCKSKPIVSEEIIKDSKAGQAATATAPVPTAATPVEIPEVATDTVPASGTTEAPVAVPPAAAAQPTTAAPTQPAAQPASRPVAQPAPKPVTGQTTPPAANAGANSQPATPKSPK